MATQIFHFSNTGISSGQRFYLKDEVSGIFLRNLNINTNSGIITSGNLQVSGTGIFNALDLNNVDNLSLSGVDITITSGNVNVSGKIINSGMADIFPASETKRRYPPEGLGQTTTNTPQSGHFQYFPFLIKKDAVNPKICVEVFAINTATPIRYGIYSGNNGFEGAKLFFSGSINCPNTIGVYTGDINTTLPKGPYIIATANTGTLSPCSFRMLAINYVRPIFGDPTGNATLFGGGFGTSSHYYETGIDLLTTIGSGAFIGSSVSPIPALIY